VDSTHAAEDIQVVGCCERGSGYSGWSKRVKPRHQHYCSHIVTRNSEFRLMQFWNYKLGYQRSSLSQLRELCSYLSTQCYDQFLYCYSLNELSNDTLHDNCISIISALNDKALWSCSIAKLSSGQNGYKEIKMQYFYMKKHV